MWGKRGEPSEGETVSDAPRHIAFVPLAAFESEVSEIALAENLAIRRMTPEEWVRATGGDDVPGVSAEPLPFAIYVWAEVADDSSMSQVDAQVQFSRVAYGEALRLVCALRLFKSGTFCATRLLFYRSDLSGPNGGWHTFAQAHSNPLGFEMSNDEVEEFINFWTNATEGLNDEALEYALFRFSEACGRMRPEDRLVDLSIAAEAMFLTTGKDELTFRLALHFALFLEKEPDARRAVFDRVKELYGVRSYIVHGRTSSQPKKLKFGKAPEIVNLTIATSEFEDLMRRALRRAVLNCKGNPWPPDWVDVALGASL
jgi:Apea-like HEPN